MECPICGMLCCAILHEWKCQNPDCLWDEGDPIPCPDGEHRWIRRRMGGAPDAVESYEVIEYCEECGIENVED